GVLKLLDQGDEALLQQARGADDDAIGLDILQEAEQPLFPVPVILGVAQDNLVVVFPGGVFRAARDVDEELGGNAGDDQAEQKRPVGGKAASDPAAPVPKHLDRVEDARASLWADLAFVVQHARNGRLGYASVL